jgi:hypothetical protein
MSTESIVTLDILNAAKAALEHERPLKAMMRLRQVEPVLVDHVYRGLMAVWAESLGSLDSEPMDRVHWAAMSVMLSGIDSLRLGMYELWCGTAVGSILAEIDPTLARHARRPRKE